MEPILNFASSSPWLAFFLAGVLAFVITSLSEVALAFYAVSCKCFTELVRGYNPYCDADDEQADPETK